MSNSNNTPSPTTGWAPLAVYGLILIIIFVGGFLYMSYSVGEIAPPAKPQNLEELYSWDEDAIYRLAKSLGCFNLPSRYMNNFPEDLVEIEEECSTITDVWVEKRNQKRIDTFREEFQHNWGSESNPE